MSADPDWCRPGTPRCQGTGASPGFYPSPSLKMIEQNCSAEEILKFKSFRIFTTHLSGEERVLFLRLPFKVNSMAFLQITEQNQQNHH